MACARALHRYPETNQAELASVCVDPRYENQGIGGKLMQYTEGRAREAERGPGCSACRPRRSTTSSKKGGFVPGTPQTTCPQPAASGTRGSSGRRLDGAVEEAVTTPAGSEDPRLLKDKRPSRPAWPQARMFFGCDSCFTRWSSSGTGDTGFKERGSLFRLSRSYRQLRTTKVLAGVNRGPGTTGICHAWRTFARW